MTFPQLGEASLHFAKIALILARAEVLHAK